MNNIKLWEILVPKYDNNGTEFTTHYHRLWDKKVIKLSGGMTILHSVKGKWYSDMIFIDEVIPVRIACEKKTIKKIAEVAVKHYYQDSIMIYKISDDVMFVKR